LNIGIHEALYQALSGASRTLVRKVLARHCAKSEYLQALAAGGARYGLDGSVCGEVAEPHRVAAILVLASRSEKSVKAPATRPPPSAKRVETRPVLRLARSRP
jgi:sRNA-binding protein